MKKQNIQKMVMSGLFVSLALVFKLFFTFYIPLFGQNGMSVGFSGVFSIMPSLLFGPWYGFAVSALADLLGHFLKPAGAYMPLLTLTAGLGGFLRGSLWLIFKKTEIKKLRRMLVVLIAATLLLGLYTTFSLKSDGILTDEWQFKLPDERIAHVAERHSPVGRLVLARSVNAKDPQKTLATIATYLTVAPLAFAVLGSLLLGVDSAFKKYAGDTHLLAIFIAMLLSGLAVTTLNTIVLREILYPSWKLLPFFVVWLPRVLEEIVMGAVKAYLVSLLYKIYVSQRRLNSGIRV